MANGSTRATPRRRSIAFTSSATVPMATLFSQPTKVDLLMVGGGGGGANLVRNSSNSTCYGGGGGAGGGVVEYSNVWVTGDLVVTVGAGGAANTPGGATSVVCAVPGPFSGVYTSPGGENGGRGPDGMGQSRLFKCDLPLAPNGVFIGADVLDPTIVITLSPYNEVQSSPAAFLDAASRLTTAADRATYANLHLSPPLYFATTEGSDPFPASRAGAPILLYPGNTPPANFFEPYDIRMSKNPGRGVSGGSTGGAGGGVLPVGKYTTNDSVNTGDTVNTNTPSPASGYPGSSFGDGLYSTRTAHPYGGGGGGGSVSSPAAGGPASNGGGGGASSTNAAFAGAANTGGGGGGASTQFTAASGGSGLVIMTWTE
jgi:hypothetical protein